LEEFGDDRLAAALTQVDSQQTAADVANGILAATDEYSGAGSAPSDDRTLVVLRVNDHASQDFSKLPIIY
jgi:serine phosphatase RsbU (regulator of sigma subunit)